MVSEASVPSYTYPGLPVLEGVLKVANGKTADQIAHQLGIRSWRVRSAIGGLRKMDLVSAVRNGRRTIYFRREGSVHDSYIRAFYRYLLPLFKGKSLEWMMENLWPEDRKSTSYKRATYLSKLGKDLGLLVSSGKIHELTSEGLRMVLARAIEAIYVIETEGRMGEYISLTRVFSRLSEWGVEPSVVRRSILGAISELDGRLSPSPALSETVMRDGIKASGGSYLYYLSLRRKRWE